MRRIAAGHHQGSRLDAERAALFDIPEGPCIGPLHMPLAGIRIDGVDKFCMNTDGSWNAPVVEAEEILEEDDIVVMHHEPEEAAPAEVPFEAVPHVGSKRVQPPREAKAKRSRT